MIENYLYDIALGITSIQTIDTGRQITLSQAKNIKEQPKTEILNVIHNIVEPALNDIHNALKWQYERNFITSEGKVFVIDYPHYGDACIIEIDDNRIRVNKKYLKELYNKKL